MNATEAIIQMAEKNNGIVTNMMVVDAGISRGNLKYLVDRGRLEKVSRGVYTLPKVWEDELFNLQMRFKRGIFSYETALFLCDLTDRTPNYYNMTFPSNYNITNPKVENVRCTQSKPSLYDIGITSLFTPGGNEVNAYCRERTLCDIISPRSRVDIQIIADAYKRYSAKKDKNIPLLSEYAKTFKVEKRLRSYLEVLL